MKLFIDMHCMRPCDIKFMLSVVLNSMSPPVKTTCLTFVQLSNVKQTSDLRTNSYTFNRDSKPTPVVSKSFFKVLFLGDYFYFLNRNLTIFINLYLYVHSFENNARMFWKRVIFAISTYSTYCERTYECSRR